ncbi:glycine cleavage system aminomethyltransferase GcvT [Georgenia sp. Z1491]|uniref:glycine cleavage system aminomethyltransferase GcvT n=1 Tax=Georgenia sp. Z1491 TaxID=3416707 RepID=UPI003CEFB7D6
MTEQDVLHTPLHAAHVRAGASMTPFAGWDMPLRYTAELEEHRAVRSAAGLFDLSHMAQVVVSGPGAPEALDRALVTRPSTAEVGRARYSVLLAPDGGIVDDLVVYRTAGHEYLVVANAANRLVVVDELTRRAEGLDGVSVDDRTTARALVAVQGPAAPEVLAALTNDDLTTLRYFRARPATVAGVELLLARTGYTGETGYELMLGAAHAPRLWEALLEAGAAHGLVQAGLAARDSLRLEAGMPLYGNELTRRTGPDEVGLARLVDLADGHAFVGRAAVEAARQRPTGRALVALTGEGRRAARAGSSVLLGEDRIGEVTSGALSPTLGHPIALALVDRALEPGTTVEADVRGRRQPMTVVESPFYRRAG